MSEGPGAVGTVLARFRLDARQQRQVAAVLELLAEDPRAPTTIRDPHHALDAHFADSLVALEVDDVRAAETIADLGSGAGFPGIAIAIALPQAQVRLIESQQRKCAFLLRAREAAGLENASIVCTRAEDWAEGILGNDVVLARALAPQPVVLEYAAPLLRVGGSLIDWRGRRDEGAERAAAGAAEALGMRLRELREVEPFEGATDRRLHVFTKARPTPPRFPRRPGVARKRPVGR